MSDWTDTLDARRAGLIEGFHGTDERIDRLEVAERPEVPLAEHSEAPPAPEGPVESPIGGHGPIQVVEPARSPSVHKAPRKTTAKKATAAKKASGSSRKRS